MPYLLALIGVIAVAVLLWRTLGAHRVGVAGPKPRPVAPDDDPEFLRSLRDQHRDKPDE